MLIFKRPIAKFWCLAWPWLGLWQWGEGRGQCWPQDLAGKLVEQSINAKKTILETQCLPNLLYQFVLHHIYLST